MHLPVVVVHHNRCERLSNTLGILAESTVPVVPIVVDCGSDAHHRASAFDTVADYPAEHRLRTLLPRPNIGFGPGANEGFRHALRSDDEWEWIGLCPHDAVIAPDAIERMLAAAANRPGAGLMCADYGDGMSPRFDRFLGPHLTASPVSEGWDDVDYPHGTFMLARRGLLDRVGLFDERYFAYCEETDLGIRARNANWEIGLVRGAMVDNPETNTSTAVVDYLQTRNTVQLVARHGGWWPATFRFGMAAWQALRGERPGHRGGMFFHRRARLRALRDVIARRSGPPPASVLATPTGKTS